MQVVTSGAGRLITLLVLMLVAVGCGDSPAAAPDEQQADQDSADPQDGQPADVADEEAGEPDSVTLAQSYLPLPSDSIAWYTTLEKGFFADENLDVDVVRGFGSADTVKRVATGEVEFGIADPSAFIPMRLNEDVPVVAVASVYAESPQGVMFRVGEGIEEPADLEGRTIACSHGSAPMLNFSAFAQVAGVDADAVEWKLSDPGANDAAFVSGQTDANCTFVTDLVRMQEMAGEDAAFDYFSYAEYGVPNYAQMIIAAERTIAERPDLVERFVRAALRGIEFSIENPEEAVEIFVSHAPDNDPDYSHISWEIMLDRGVMENEDTERHGFGYISDERMAATFDTLVEAMDLEPEDYTPEDVYTTDYLP